MQGAVDAAVLIDLVQAVSGGCGRLLLLLLLLLVIWFGIYWQGADVVTQTLDKCVGKHPLREIIVFPYNGQRFGRWSFISRGEIQTRHLLYIFLPRYR